MSFGTRLKEKRESLGITQPQLAEMLGVSKGAIGNWETDVNSPRATLLYDLFDILHCDANYLFQDETRELYKDEASPEEFENIIKKYRNLDDYGRETINIILQRETARVQQIIDLRSFPAAVVEFPQDHISELAPNAAHERTDIEITDEMRKHDDDLMDDENF